ncbi:PAS domain-containing protein [uncultured Lentibacter sp.]|uniref:PAS domain-containing protein n=1 Tax=uncultured Lentibacter sp. TaxID=1659309 RepID=UPI00260B9DE4|nr:PAS domain-containing protein [uncultured Lentibacter sp.]MCW1956842.1 PAS domain-containing protein [Roseobacter sp.]
MNKMVSSSAFPNDDKTDEVVDVGDRILVSETDFRGVIRFANKSFCEVAEYKEAELLNAPHKIVRHPTMPKGAFHLVWERIKQGLPTSAYIKNRCKNGQTYWVFATVLPYKDGFISVRIKPQGKNFEAVEGLYRQVYEAEQTGATVEQSAALILSAVKGLGYGDYADFSFQALNEEYQFREANNVLKWTGHLETLAEKVADTDRLIEKIAQGFDQVCGEPVNLRVLSGQLGDAGIALGCIAQNYEIMALEMQKLLEKLRCQDGGVLERMDGGILAGLYASQVASLIQQSGHAGSLEAEQNHIIWFTEKSRLGFNEVVALGAALPDTCRQIRRRINGLDVVKMLCRVESERMHAQDSGLSGIIDRLETFHANTDRYLTDLTVKANQIAATKKMQATPGFQKILNNP